MADRLALEKRRKVSCECATCRSYCEHVPGWFLPDEIAAAAKAKGLSQREFFRRHCTLDFWAGDTVFVIRPKTVRESGGQVAETDPRGQCALFENQRCAIHQAKPYECAVAVHTGDPGTMHQEVADAWREPEAMALVQRLYGGVPEEPEYGIYDMISLLLGR